MTYDDFTAYDFKLEEKQVTINYKTEYRVVKERNGTRPEWEIGDGKKSSKYRKKYDTEIGRNIWIAKSVFQNLYKKQENFKRFSLEKKKKELNCYVISIYLYVREY